jgi:hypothetical protein
MFLATLTTKYKLSFRLRRILSHTPATPTTG